MTAFWNRDPIRRALERQRASEREREIGEYYQAHPLRAAGSIDGTDVVMTLSFVDDSGYFPPLYKVRVDANGTTVLSYMYYDNNYTRAKRRFDRIRVRYGLRVVE